MLGSCEAEVYETRQDGCRYCDYCGSVHPEDLAKLLEEGKAVMHGSDWKYGYPHKFYVDIKTSDLLGDKTEYTKFYINHLQILDNETFDKVIPHINKACGITFSKDEKGLKYVAPYHGYQKD